MDQTISSGRDSMSAESRNLKLSVVIPAYREGARLARTLDATAAYLERCGEFYEIIVVDDGSTDDTTAVAEAWSSAYPLMYGQMRALRYEINRGKGHAVRYGVLRADGEYILFMDADLATPIEELPHLEDALADGAVFAIGSRPLRESQLLVRQPLYRELAGRLFNGFVQAFATPGIQDTQCGFKLLQADGARAIFTRCRLDGFSFDVEALFVARRLGLQIAEVPVRWSHQEGTAAFAGKGAYLRHGLRMLADLARIRWSHRALRPVDFDLATAAAAKPGLTAPPSST